MLATVQSSNGVRVISWELVRSVGMSDGDYVALVSQLGTGTGNW